MGIFVIKFLSRNNVIIIFSEKEFIDMAYVNEKKREKRAPAKEKLTMHSALSHKGYYDKDSNWNSLTTTQKFPGKVLRNRVEVLIFNERGQIYLCREKNFFRVPGGSIEKNKSNIEQVKSEAKEEARLNITNVQSTGVTYIRFFSKPYILPGSSVYWDGVQNTVYTADYVSRYTGNIKKSLKDGNMSKLGKFYDIEDVFFYLKPEYRKIISNRKKKNYYNR